MKPEFSGGYNGRRGKPRLYERVDPESIFLVLSKYGRHYQQAPNEQ